MRSDGQTIVVQAEVRDAGLHAEMLYACATNERPAFPMPPPAKLCPYNWRAFQRSYLHLHLCRRDRAHRPRAPTVSPSRMAFNNLTADEVDRRALSDGLFGTQTLSTNAWGTMQRQTRWPHSRPKAGRRSSSDR